MNGPKLPSCVEPWWSEKTDAQKTDAQRQIDDLLSGKTKPLDVGEIEHAAEVAAAEERGRRRGVEERDELRDRMHQTIAFLLSCVASGEKLSDEEEAGIRAMLREGKR